MADNKVEPRPGLAGTGMAADPESIAALQKEAARRARAIPPQRSFKSVRQDMLEEEGREVPTDHLDDEETEPERDSEETTDAPSAKEADGQKRSSVSDRLAARGGIQRRHGDR